MDVKSLRSSLLFRIIVAIILGIVLSLILREMDPGFAEPFAKIFITFNSLFSGFLGFFVPILIFALITPAIAGLGRGAGKWLGIVVALAYGSTIVAGLLAWGTALALYPSMLGGQQLETRVADIEEGSLAPFFSIEMPAPFEVMTALLMAFTIGMGMTVVKSETLFTAADELRSVIMKVIEAFIIPLLPLYIFGMFLGVGMNGNLADILVAFGKVLVLAVVGTWVYLAVQFIVAGAVAGRNPWTVFRNTLPAYFTALGTSSSAATIPVSYRSARNNDVEENVAGFVIPLCATIHLSGSMIKIVLYTFAITFMANIEVSIGLSIGFLFMLAITMVAAPGVPGGAIMAAVGLLSSMMGFNDSQIALMIAAYIAIDSFGTAANVAGDNAIALVINRFAKGEINNRSEAVKPLS